MNGVWASVLSGAAAALVVGLLGWLTTRKVDQARTADLISLSSERLIARHERDQIAATKRAERAEQRAERAEKKVDELEVEVTELRKEVRIVRDIVVEAGLEERLPRRNGS